MSILYFLNITTLYYSKYISIYLYLYILYAQILPIYTRYKYKIKVEDKTIPYFFLICIVYYFIVYFLVGSIIKIKLILWILGIIGDYWWIILYCVASDHRSSQGRATSTPPVYCLFRSMLQYKCII